MKWVTIQCCYHVVVNQLIWFLKNSFNWEKFKYKWKRFCQFRKTLSCAPFMFNVRTSLTQSLSCVENPTKKKKFCVKNIRRRFYQFRETLSCAPCKPNVRTTLIKSLCHLLKILQENKKISYKKYFSKLKRYLFLYFFSLLINKRNIVKCNALNRKNPARNYMFKVDYINARIRCRISSKWTIKTADVFWCIYC